MAYNSALTNLRYDLNNYIVELRRISNLAATFLMKSDITKMQYLNDIENDIFDYETRFNNERNPYIKREIVFELKREVELANKEYQILRTNDHVTYYVTDIFEDQGVIKYSKIAGGVVAGTLELFAAHYFYKISSTLNIRRFRGVAIVFVAYGANNIYEAMTPVIFEHSSPGAVRIFYREIAEVFGFDKDQGDYAYSFGELSLSIYAGIRKPIVTQHSKRLADKLIGETPGTGRLFRNIHSDYIPSWDNKSTIMRLWFLGYTGYKAKLLFWDEKYKFENKYN
ncbi:TPA: DUF4225 domain-containing protein [Enterobacter cancerogenus]|nr:DUF4225 domain-containing protein [Enterobacter cancerogenus]HDR2164521.1 DUF4225 domain-containing protein [Enterobacter cancerogenus]HDR2266519.1 DUF4225 domain-containing protein [Enterobacter cancerogenus]